MNPNSLKDLLAIVAIGASISMIVLAYKTDKNEASKALVHVADAVKECAVTYRSCYIS